MATTHTPRWFRRLFREGKASDVRTTSGICSGYYQANLVILPGSVADEFRTWCQKNAQAAPLLGSTSPPSRGIPELGEDMDVATDVPLYRIWRNGVHVDTPRSVADLMGPGGELEDGVGFALGCSFSFESALQAAGVPVRNIDQGVNVSMYKTKLSTTPVGPFHGPLVVSMRPIPAALVDKAVEITGSMPRGHGAPIAVGEQGAQELGINLSSGPDFGDAVKMEDGDVPVFWACGVTSSLAVSNLPLVVTHDPGYMLLTDLAE